MATLGSKLPCGGAALESLRSSPVRRGPDGCSQPFHDIRAKCSFDNAARAKHLFQFSESNPSKGNARPDQCSTSNQWPWCADSALCKVMRTAQTGSSS